MAAADQYTLRAYPDPFDRHAAPVQSSGTADACLPGRQDSLFHAVHAEDRGGLVALSDHLERYPEFTVARLDVRVRSTSGDWQWREAVASNFLAGEGQRAVDIQWRDTSRRPSAVSGASTADDRWQLAATVADDIISVADCRRQTLFASPALLRVTGYSLSEIQSSDFQGRVHPEDLALVELARDFNLRGQGTRIEYRYRCKNGEYAWLDSQATPVLSDSGSVQQIVVTTRDITLRKAAERGLQQSESHWRTLVQNAPDVIELYSRDGVVQFANRARPGRLLADVVGCSGTQDLTPESCEPFLRALERACCSGEIVDVETQTCLPGQPQAWYWSRITPLRAAGQAEQLLVVSRDVTQRRREAEQSAALSSAAHNVAQQIAGQLVTSLDRLEAVEAALTPGATAAALRHAQEAIRSAAELAGRLAGLADSMPSREGSVTFPIAPALPAARQVNILLVDDDESVRASLLALLRARGVRVVAAADGQQAIDMFQARADEIDAVVLDQNMPGKNGVSVLGELRAMRPDIKVVISSGDVVEPWETEVDECNRLAFAHKALGPQELIAQLERLLERKL